MSTIPFRFVLAALACWRVSFLLAREAGPARVLERSRNLLGRGFLGQLTRCVKCTGLWVAVAFTPFVGAEGTDQIVVWLALAAVTALVDEWTKPPFEWQQADEATNDASSQDDRS